MIGVQGRAPLVWLERQSVKQGRSNSTAGCVSLVKWMGICKNPIKDRAGCYK